MNHVISLKFVINHWRLFAMQDGYTLHGTVILESDGTEQELAA